MIQVAIEGADGSGKSTLAKALVKRINNDVPGHKALLLSETGQTIQGFRDFVLTAQSNPIHGLPTDLTSNASAALFIANMAQTAFEATTWAGAVQGAGEVPVVVRDRTILTTLIYQGFLTGGPALVRSIWTAYRCLVDESFDTVFILDGSHKHKGPKDPFTALGQSRKARMLYLSIESLLGPGFDTLGRDPALMKAMGRAMTNTDRASFAERFHDWVTIDTVEYDTKSALEFAFLHLAKQNRWTLSA
jgi:thymidylate kinase